MVLDPPTPSGGWRSACAPPLVRVHPANTHLGSSEKTGQGCWEMEMAATWTLKREKWTDSDPVRGYWFRDGDKTDRDPPVATNNPHRSVLKRTKNRFFLIGDPQKNNCSLNIRETRKKDAGSYFFHLERGQTKFNYLWNMITLHVTALTDTPYVLFPETLEAGYPSNLICFAPWACGSPTFSWAGTSVSLSSTNTNGSSVLTVTPQPWDHGTNLTCQVTLPGSGVTTRTTIILNVSYAPKNLTLTIYKGVDPGKRRNAGWQMQDLFIKGNHSSEKWLNIDFTGRRVPSYALYC
ncbi:sialic acid-binding Ig-like lectin 12 isoform X9 [Mesocricetus auratus]|uniref:Sialic acid-binding Ig-like lectin 12 isoform X9 n=1 Tax=Mesocricetus auratus TaxID=10036 RepID=A0ABM2WUQ7_MESAU|nr:sialic acid-binding Ig-like lectin 12 isoform X9 [Mesocricetus auratus]